MSIAIDNVVFALPEADPDATYDSHARPLTTFYADLLGMQILREDWFMIGKDSYSYGNRARWRPASVPRLAFGDGPAKKEMPRWPDPDYPQQLHLDLPASDLDAAEELALRLGATRLQDKGDYRTYADPVGHPFCLYRDEADEDETGRPLSGRVGRVVIDCLSPRALAGFYAELLDMRSWELDTPERVVIARDDGMLPALAFQHARFPAPRWPDPAYPQQLHLDIFAEDPRAAQELALRLGAIRLPDIGGSAPVYADPAGHPFCLCSPGT